MKQMRMLFNEFPKEHGEVEGQQAAIKQLESMWRSTWADGTRELTTYKYIIRGDGQIRE